MNSTFLDASPHRQFRVESLLNNLRIYINAERGLHYHTWQVVYYDFIEKVPI